MNKNVFDNELIWQWVDSNKENTERYEATEKLIPSDVGSLADIGCGHGGFLNIVAAHRKELKLKGVDSSEGALSHVAFEKLMASITDLPFKPGEFDCVSALEVLEHLTEEDFEKALSELSRVANKYIIVSVPYMENLDWNSTTCTACKNKFHVDGHYRTFNGQKMANLFKSGNFKCVNKMRAGWSKTYLFHKLYVSLFQRRRKNDFWHYTVCPNCNTELTPPPENLAHYEEIPIAQQTKLQRIKSGVKSVWPKIGTSYWIIALYKKNED